MNSERIKEFLDRIPVAIFLVGYLLYLGLEYYSFENDLNSPKLSKLNQIHQIKSANLKLDAKLKEMNLFVASLETKKIELRGLARELQEIKAVLSENIDVPGFMKMVTTEAKKINLIVLGLKPDGSELHPFYGEFRFTLGFRGIFTQVVSFLDRLANLNRIIQIDQFKITPASSGTQKFLLLEGVLQLKVFKYLGSSEDGLGNPKSEPGSSQKGVVSAPTAVKSARDAEGTSGAMHP